MLVFLSTFKRHSRTRTRPIWLYLPFSSEKAECSTVRLIYYRRTACQTQRRVQNRDYTRFCANPNYAGDETLAAANNENSRSVDADSLSFAPLPGTAQEATAITPFFPNVILFTEDQATETNLKQVNTPSILHIATHSFFLHDEFVPPADPDSRSTLSASFSLTDAETPIQITIILED
ncbi:MAG: CHAT domain-containing protein [Phormidesmis sp.]